jgi:hypothetical protein
VKYQDRPVVHVRQAGRSAGFREAGEQFVIADPGKAPIPAGCRWHRQSRRDPRFGPNASDCHNGARPLLRGGKIPGVQRRDFRSAGRSIPAPHKNDANRNREHCRDRRR